MHKKNTILIKNIWTYSDYLFSGTGGRVKRKKKESGISSYLFLVVFCVWFYSYCIIVLDLYKQNSYQYV